MLWVSRLVILVARRMRRPSCSCPGCHWWIVPGRTPSQTCGPSRWRLLMLPWPLGTPRLSWSTTYIQARWNIVRACLSKGEYFHWENENIFTENFVPSQCCYLLKRCVGWNTVFCDGCSPRSSSIDETSTTRGTAASTTSAVTAAVPAVDGPDTHALEWTAKAHYIMTYFRSEIHTYIHTYMDTIKLLWV